MKIKYFILSGIISSAILSMTVFAEPEKTEKETEPTIAVTEVSKTVQETTSITESTTAAVTTSTTEKTTTPSFYDEILAYVGEENAPVLNENLDNNAMTIDSSTIDYSNKSMYTITTRSGDVFYLIINSDGSVYFLNPVDTADLTAMLSDSNDNKLNENALENIQLNHISNMDILLGGSEQIAGKKYDIILTVTSFILQNFKELCKLVVKTYKREEF